MSTSVKHCVSTSCFFVFLLVVVKSYDVNFCEILCLNLFDFVSLFVGDFIHLHYGICKWKSTYCYPFSDNKVKDFFWSAKLSLRYIRWLNIWESVHTCHITETTRVLESSSVGIFQPDNNWHPYIAILFGTIFLRYLWIKGQLDHKPQWVDKVTAELVEFWRQPNSYTDVEGAYK